MTPGRRQKGYDIHLHKDKRAKAARITQLSSLHYVYDYNMEGDWDCGRLKCRCNNPAPDFQHRWLWLFPSSWVLWLCGLLPELFLQLWLMATQCFCRTVWCLWRWPLTLWIQSIITSYQFNCEFKKMWLGRSQCARGNEILSGCSWYIAIWTSSARIKSSRLKIQVNVNAPISRTFPQGGPEIWLLEKLKLQRPETAAVWSVHPWVLLNVCR